MNLKEFLLAKISDDAAKAERAADAGPQWYNAPIPPRWHRCEPYTTGSTARLTLVERCACGAIRLDGDGPWMERNSRRKRP